MAFPSCSLWLFVARTDVSFMMHTIPHLVRMNHFPFEEKVLAIDTAPLSGDKVSRPGVGTMEELQDCTQQLLKSGIVDRIVEMNYDPNYRQRIYHKHFGTPIRNTHNYKGYPILGSIFKIEECKSDYMLHFDSDMLLHQQPDYDWIVEAIELMQQYPEMMFSRPLTGPPTEDEIIYQSRSYEKKIDKFYTSKFFGSRVYLIDCKHFDKLLPLPILWRSYRQTFMNKLPISFKNILNQITGKGKLDSWEIMVSKKLEKTHYFRGTLTNSKAWTLHPKDRSPAFINALPSIIERIEVGEYPPEQAGHYDLISDLWI
jgi:hypothetical protein